MQTDNREMIGWMSGYVESSRGPWGSLCFVAPALGAYELASWWLGADRSGSATERMLRGMLDALGLGSAWLAPALPIAILVVWHLVSRRRAAWRWTFGPLMALECLLLAAVALGLAEAASRHWADRALAQAWADGSAPLAAHEAVVGWLGKGLYEETVFRLMVLPLTMLALRRSGWTLLTSGLSALLLTSLGLAAVDLAWTQGGDGFHWLRPLAQAAGGGLLAVLFWFRGFGVAAGTHVAFNGLAAAMLAF